MKNLMKRAWMIAKMGQKKHGGKVKEYLAEALKMAWAEVKNFESSKARLEEKLNEYKELGDKVRQYEPSTPEVDVQAVLVSAHAHNVGHMIRMMIDKIFQGDMHLRKIIREVA